ncbi:MAG: YceD family protein [Solirubrobacteraceae bacterium]
MPSRVDSFDLGSMHLQSGEGRRLALEVPVEPFTLAEETYLVTPALIPVELDISRTTGEGYALRLRLRAKIEGPCMRCLEPAALVLEVDAREVSLPGETDELDSPYVDAEVLALADWTREALALVLPAAILCRADCAGLCAVCGADLNTAEEGHHHDAVPDPRWAKLAELRFER